MVLLIKYNNYILKPFLFYIFKVYVKMKRLRFNNNQIILIKTCLLLNLNK